MKPIARETISLEIIWGACLCLLTLFIAYPLFRVFCGAGVEHWRRVFASGRWAASLRNTLLLVALSTFFSVLAGSVYAYAVSRGGLPFEKFFAFIPVLHLVTPPFVGGLSFMLLFGRQGFFTKTLFHQDISLYGLPGLLTAQTLCFFPLAFIVMKNTFDGMNPALEYAARDAGAGKFRVFTSVTLPLSVGGLVSAALFIAVSVMSDFGNPVLIGGRFNVLAVDLYTQLTGWSNAGTSAVLGIILLAPASVLFALQRFLFYKKSARAAVIGSRSSSMPLPFPPLWVRALLFVFCACIAFIVAAQFLAVIGGAFSRVWGADSSFTAAHFFTALNYRDELFNTLLCAFCAALAASFFASLIAFLTHRTNLPLRKAAESAAMLPAAIPGSLIGLAFVLAFNGASHLTGTRLIIIIAMTVCALPAALRIVSSAVLAVKPVLDDSARSLGASRIKLFFTVICPLISRGIISAFVFTFVRECGTLSAVIFLTSFKTKLSSVLILNLASQGDWGTSAALAFILTAVIFLFLGILRLLGMKNLIEAAHKI